MSLVKFLRTILTILSGRYSKVQLRTVFQLGLHYFSQIKRKSGVRKMKNNKLGKKYYLLHLFRK